MDTVSLSEYLRTGTAEAHRAAEGSRFVSLFMSGRLDRLTHSRHLLALHGVYQALEDALDTLHADHRVGMFHLPALWRRAAIEADLEYFYGPSWRREEPVPSARAYAGHLSALLTTQPLRLVSHAYVRYLGDLSGGQILKRMAAKQLGLDADGLRFYDFPAIVDPVEFKRNFRQRLDEIPLTNGERDDLLDEARIAFRLNATIFAELVPGSDPADEPPPSRP
jgi:heme oxygenase (biliverdin-producing, ferredoxin)